MFFQNSFQLDGNTISSTFCPGFLFSIPRLGFICFSIQLERFLEILQYIDKRYIDKSYDGRKGRE